MRYTVELYRYDLTGGLAKQYSAELLGMHVDGVWHTSIVVYNKEYYFDGGVGIITELHPGHTRFGTPYKIDTLGQTTKSEIEFKEWIDTFNCDNTSAEHSDIAFGPNDYHLLDNNCNHFTQAASRFLLNQDIPSDIRQMIPTLLSTPLGCILRPMLERATQNTNTSFGQNNNKATKTSNASPESRKPPNPSTSAEQIGKGLLSTKTSLSEDENDDLITIQAMIETNPYLHEESRENKELQRSSNNMTGLKLTCKAITVLESVLQKIIAFPCERKYRILSTKSNTYQSYLLPLEEYGVREVLRLAGFIQRQRNVIVSDESNNAIGDEVESSETFTEWILKDEKSNACVLQRILEAIQYSMHNIENMYETNEYTDMEVNIFKHKDNGVSEVKSKSKKEHNEKFEEVSKNIEEIDTFQEEFPLEVVCTFNADTKNNRKCRIARNVGIDNNNYVSSVDQNKAYNDFEQNMEETLTEKVPEKTDKCHSTNVRLKNSIDRGDIYTTVYSQSNVLRENLINVVSTISLHERGDDLLHLANALSGEPINSLEQLIQWREPLEYVENSTNTLSLVPPFPCTRAISRVTSYGKSSELLESEEEEEHHLRLLVCHDMQGGYLYTDNAQFSIKLSSFTERMSSATTKCTVCKNERNHYFEILAQAYDVRYWPYVDYFVYFSHHRVTIPPADWVASAHRNGVPILGTLIMEGSSAMREMSTILLSSAHNMALVVRQLVRLCNFYRFDGYLLNFECNVDPSLVSRVKLFVTVLREELNKSHNLNFDEQSSYVATTHDRSDRNNNVKMNEEINESKCYKKEEVNHFNFSDKQKRFVIWYDALTTEGEVRYQNALTSLNKPFYDRADGILLNYFWQPHQLTQTVQEITGHPQRSNVFVGIDVFGRHMYDGGQFNSVKSVQRIANAGLSVGLFAPGWTLEMCHYAKHNTRIITKVDPHTEYVSSNNNNSNKRFIKNSNDVVSNEISSLQYYRQLRHEFGMRESKLWEPMLYYFTRHTRVLEGVNKLRVHENKSEQTLIHENLSEQEHCKWFWTCFCDALGLNFFVNGKPVNSSLQNKYGMCNSIWCQRAMQQDTPPLSYSATSPVNSCFDQTECHYDAELIQAKGRDRLTSKEINSFFYLYSLDSRKTDEMECETEWKSALSHTPHYKSLTKEVIAEWCESVAWFGNRSLRFTLAPSENVVISDWIIKLDLRKSCDITNMHFISCKEKECIFDNLNDVSNNNQNTMINNTKDRIQQEVILVDVIYNTNHMTQNKIREQRGVLIQLEHRSLRNKHNVIVNDANATTDIGNSNIETVPRKLISKKENLFANANNEICEDSWVGKHKQFSNEIAEVNENDENSCRLLFDSNCNNNTDVEDDNSNEWSLVRYIFRRQCKIDELTSQDAEKMCKDSHSSSLTKNAESMVTAVAIVNKSAYHSLLCQVGGVGVTSVSLIRSNDERATREELFAIPSPLMPLRKHK